MCFLWIKHQIIFAGNPHEVSQVGIVFCLSVAMDSDVICDSDASLEDVLGADEVKGSCRKQYLLNGLLKS